jgi:hypothetical protein
MHVEECIVTSFSLTVLYIILINQYVYSRTQKIAETCYINKVSDFISEDGTPLTMGKVFHTILFFLFAMIILSNSWLFLTSIIFMLFILNFV